MKKIIFLFLFSIACGKEFYYSSGTDEKDIINGYNNWQDEILDLKLRENSRELELLESKGELQKERLKQMYRDAEFKIITERNQLKNDLERAKIYYYYHKKHKKYYYYDYNYNIIYLN